MTDQLYIFTIAWESIKLNSLVVSKTKPITEEFFLELVWPALKKFPNANYSKSPASNE